MIKLVNTKQDKSNFKKIKQLYESTFPKDEQVPFFYLKLNAKKSISDIFAIVDDQEFIGLLIHVYHKDIVFLWYLAISENQRGKGYGTMILNEISKRYHDKRMILNIEEIDENSIHVDEQLKRRNFYINNGFQPSGFKTEEYGVIYEMFYKNGNVTYEEYIEMMKEYSIKELVDKNYRKV